VTVGWVSEQCDYIEAATIVAAAHSDLTLLIIEFYDDSRGFRVPESIRQRLSRNAENLVHHVAVENIVPSAAFYRKINCPNSIEIRSDTLNQGFQLGIVELLGSKPANSIAAFYDDAVGSRKSFLESLLGYMIGRDSL
jgi:hypothetical protein